MDEDIYGNAIYCEDDNEYRIYCDICDNLCIVRFYKNHLNSQTHTNKFQKKKSISNISTQIKKMTKICYSCLKKINVYIQLK